MIIVGLTGSIGMGKTTAAKMLQDLGCPVQDADKVVHDLMAKDGTAVNIIAKNFPEVVRNGIVDRQKLGARVFSNDKDLKLLESILHPMVDNTRLEFLQKCENQGHKIAVLEVPLLFETKGNVKCDYTILLTAPAEIQRQRVLSRPGMDDKKLTGILARQMPDMEKQKHADFIIDSSTGQDAVLEKLTEIVSLISDKQGHCWPDKYIN